MQDYFIIIIMMLLSIGIVNIVSVNNINIITIINIELIIIVDMITTFLHCHLCTVMQTIQQSR